MNKLPRDIENYILDLKREFENIEITLIRKQYIPYYYQFPKTRWVGTQSYRWNYAFRKLMYHLMSDYKLPCCKCGRQNVFKKRQNGYKVCLH